MRRLVQRIRASFRPAAEREQAGSDRYAAAIPKLLARDAEGMRALASNAATEPEVLYYLASDVEPEVRRLVAANASTPHHANRLLCDDANADVRSALARKIARLVPDLDAEAQSRLHRQTVELLERLALDRLPHVRRIVAEEIKRTPHVPRSLVRRLAQDAEATVSAPVLQYSPLLRDEDLIEIIAATTAESALSAIASRQTVSAAVTDAVVATVDIPAVARLLANSGAEIRAETLDIIIEEAQAIQDWQAPLVVRPDLSLRAMRRIAGFVGSALIEDMCRTHDLDADTADFLTRRVRERLKQETFETPAESRPAIPAPPAGPERIDDQSIGDAAETGQLEFLTRGIAGLAGVSPQLVAKVLATRNSRAVTALVWKAGLGMRVAVKLQQHVLRLPAAKTLYARQGVAFPMTAEEMRLQLELLGISG